MKKLLALILCVMMFVAIIPTAAFAANGDEARGVAITLDTANAYNKMVENMVKHTKENIEKAYKVLAGDQVTYNAAKGMDDAVVGLVDGLAETVMGKKVLQSSATSGYDTRWTKTHTDNVKAALRALIDKKVAQEYADNSYKILDSDGNVDPILRAQTFANAVNSVLTDKDFQKGYEAVATYFAVLNLADSVNTALKDEYKAFQNSVDKSWDTNFAARYPELAATQDIIDTFAENNGNYGSATSESWIQYLLTAPGSPN